MGFFTTGTILTGLGMATTIAGGIIQNAQNKRNAEEAAEECWKRHHKEEEDEKNDNKKN